MLYNSTYGEYKKNPVYYFYSVLLLAISFSVFFILQLKDIFTPQGNMLDTKLANFMNTIRTEHLNKIFIFISRSGDAVIACILTIILLGFLYYKRRKREAIFYAINMLGTVAISQGLKVLVKRPRPRLEWLVDISKYTHVGKYSFPSGHAMISMSAALVLIYFILCIVKNKMLSATLSILLFIYAILVSFSRLYVGVHYLSDVIGGCAVSSIWAFVIIAIYRRQSR